jgi:thiamine biosynthesis lipoprotein
VEDPRDGDAYVATLALENASVVTRGDYQRYYTVDGVKYHHIIDAETLFPSVRYASVSVLSDDSAVADALSTALFCMDVAEGMKLVESLEKTYAIWVESDGTVTYSAGIEKYMK